MSKSYLYLGQPPPTEKPLKMVSLSKVCVSHKYKCFKIKSSKKPFTNMTHTKAEEFIKQADVEITRGNLHGAWNIAVEALKHFPDHAELQKYEYILAPPK